MKIYFDKEGLVESQEFYEDKELSYYLFSSVSTVYPFTKYEENWLKLIIIAFLFYVSWKIN